MASYEWVHDHMGPNNCEALSVARNAPRWIKMLRKHGFVAETAAA